MHKLFIILGILLWSATNVLAQDWLLAIHTDNTGENIKPIKYEHVLKDSLGVLREIHVYILRLHEASFLEAAMDSIVYKEKKVEAFIHVGTRHNWSMLRSGNVPDEYLYKSGYKQKFYSKTRFSYRELASLENKIIKYSENSGFPFARIELDSITLSESYFSAIFNYKSGPLIRFDTIALVGTARVKRKYLESYLGITPGALYNQQKVQNLERQLRQIQYLKVTKAPEVFFSAGKAQPVLFVNVRKCNQLDGYIGFQPNSSGAKKLLLTGEFNMNLKNLLQSGKELSIQWKRFDVQSQLLKTSYLHSRLFHSNIDVKLNFNLLKQDTTFLTLDRNAAIYLGLSSTSKIKFFTGLKSNTSLGTVQQARNTDGENYDFKFFNYGIGYTYVTLDDIFYPMKGWDISVDASTGNKKILNYETSNTEITIPTSAMQWAVEGNVQAFVLKLIPVPNPTGQSV